IRRERGARPRPGARACDEPARPGEPARRRLDDAERAAEAGRARAEASLSEARDAEIGARGAEERRLSARLRLEEAEAGAADAQRALEGLADLRDSLRSAQLRTRKAGETAAWIAKRAATWAADAQGRAETARARVRSADDELERLRGRERTLESELEEAQRHRNEVEVRRAEMRARSAAIAERALEEWGLTSRDLESFHRLEASAESAARDRARELERAMSRLGPVNPRAAEEFTEAQERETFLVAQIADLDASKRDLLKIVAEVDHTIVEVFSIAYEEVAREFEVVFERLFPGGTGRLSLTDPADVLGSGIEIEARPAGKSVKKLSLLSGGERSLVALAFLLAIFRARPSPFYLLDEVEAALDDINLQRFIGLLAELEERAQILVVTHQKRTMEAAGVLYGVTMAADGVSQVVARRMSDRPAVGVG
ncbi:MAG: AAA family ATPase, partial [Actinobacteria bacterium]|nr:AAA family ATPase [Actinomycetota bacterium]